MSNTAYQRPTKVFNPQFIALLFVNFTTFFNFQMLQANIVTYISGMTAVALMISLVPVTYSLVAMIMRPISGVWIDRFNKKTLLRVSQLGLTVTCLAYLFTNTAEAVIVVRSLNGIFFGLNSTVVMAMSSEVLPEDKMGSGLGYFGLSTILSMAVGPTVGDYIVRAAGYTTMFIVGAAATVVSAVLMIFIHSSKPEPTEKKKVSLSDMFAKEAIIPSAIMMTDSAAMAVISNFLLLHGKEMGILNISLFFTVYTAALLVTRPLAGKLADTLPSKYLIYPCQVMITLCMICLGLAKGMVPVVIAGILYGVGYGAVSPILQASALKSVPATRRGAASSTYYFAMDIPNILIPLVCAGFYSIFASYSPSYLIMSAAPLLGCLVLMLFGKKMK